jgi:hypothetical protein
MGFAIAEEVYAIWRDNGLYYRAKICQTNDDEDSYDIIFIDGIEQKNTRSLDIRKLNFLETERQEALVNKCKNYRQVNVLSLKKGYTYWKKIDNTFKKLGTYSFTTTPWEGVFHGTEQQRYFIHFIGKKIPIEPCNFENYYEEPMQGDVLKN